ncbi:MAG: UDP-N-acetylmuramoyl-L-alanyl-D-glutamate--2,6-diaminopimelate ligase [Bacilli bacterium]
MLLNKLLNDISYELIKGNLDTEVLDICYDSRKVKEGSLFVSLVGFNSDGHDYIDKAISLGANTIVVQKDVHISSDVTVIKVNDTRRCLSQLAINFFGNPSDSLTTIAITGTKGKTTTSWMIKNILEEDKKSVGVIGTMGVFYGNKHYDTVNTTPESYEIQKYFREMVDNGIEYVVIEVSSQALKVGRVDGMVFDYGVFTNLTRDHIGEGEHSDMEDYIYSKSLLFNKCKHGIFNIDDEHYSDMTKNAICDIYTFGEKKEADLVIENVKLLRKEHFIGIEVTTGGMLSDTFLVNTPGTFSAYNSSAAIMVTSIIGCTISSMKRALAKVAVKGRVEIVPVSNKYSVIIDYAHNGVSMENILTTIKEYNPKRIIALFGAGGNRSRDRRYDMGEVAGKYADLTIITEDNSRLEDVNDIMNDIETGIKKTNGKYIKISDRTDAIRYALDNATSGDIILLLGKGHETYMDKNGTKFHYDEREIIKNIMNK